MSKHAPWTVEERDHETNLVRIAGDDGITIANAKGHSARLIAAAPELLEELKYAERLLRNAADWAPSNTTKYAVLLQSEKMLAAIAKAEAA